MKLLVLFLLLLYTVNPILAQKSQGFIPLEYQYPYYKIGKGKTRIFQNIETGEQVFGNATVQVISGRNYLFSIQYASEKKIDSSVFINNKLVENFAFEDRKLIKGVVNEDIIIPGRKKYGQHRVSITHNTNDFTISTKRTEEYLKDTSLSWQGRPIDCIVLKATVFEVLQGKKKPLLKQERQTNMLFYHGKEVGLIRFIRGDGNKPQIWTLKEIRDLKY